SFYHRDDASRVHQVVQIGRVEGQRILTGNEWEAIKRTGEVAIKRWIRDQMYGKTCLVVLVGAQTASRPWVMYEIKKAWADKLGVVGVRIQGLKDLRTQKVSVRGSNPFSRVTLNGRPLSEIVTLFEPVGSDSKAVYGSISENIESLVEQAIKIR